MLKLGHAPRLTGKNLLMARTDQQQICQDRNAEGLLDPPLFPTDLVLTQPEVRLQLQTWPKDPLHQCGNNRLCSALERPWPRPGREVHEDTHKLLCLGRLFLNHNCAQISEAFS